MKRVINGKIYNTETANEDNERMKSAILAKLAGAKDVTEVLRMADQIGELQKPPAPRQRTKKVYKLANIGEFKLLNFEERAFYPHIWAHVSYNSKEGKEYKFTVYLTEKGTIAKKQFARTPAGQALYAGMSEAINSKIALYFSKSETRFFENVSMGNLEGQIGKTIYAGHKKLVEEVQK